MNARHDEPSSATPVPGWLARQAWRARVIVRDGSRLAALLLRTLRFAVAPDPSSPAIAILAAPDAIRARAIATYVVRVCNPTAHPVRLRVIANGAGTAAPWLRAFHVERPIDVPAHDVVVLALRTEWNGRASLDPRPVDERGDPPADGDHDAAPDRPRARVSVALVRDGRTVDRLDVQSALAG